MRPSGAVHVFENAPATPPASMTFICLAPARGGVIAAACRAHVDLGTCNGMAWSFAVLEDAACSCVWGGGSTHGLCKWQAAVACTSRRPHAASPAFVGVDFSDILSATDTSLCLAPASYSVVRLLSKHISAMYSQWRQCRCRHIPLARPANGITVFF